MILVWEINLLIRLLCFISMVCLRNPDILNMYLVVSLKRLYEEWLVTSKTFLDGKCFQLSFDV